MGGSTKTTQNTNSLTRTDPYAPTQPGLQDIISQVSGQAGNTTPTANETAALNSLTTNAQAGNPYAGGIAGLAGDLLKGGTDRTGMVSSAYDTLKGSLTPFTTMSTNPYDNPAFTNLTSTLSNDITDRIKSAYAGAGYTPTSSGDFAQQLGRGISQGVAPTYLQAYNDLTGQKLGTINNLFSGANTTAGLLSGLDQTALANRQAGIGASSAALQAQDSPYERLLQIEQQRRGLPLQNIGGVENLLLPLAQVGGTQQTNATTTSEQQVPLWQQITGGLLGTAGLLGQTGGFGPSGWLYGSGAGASGLLNAGGGLAALFSDRRLKTDIKKVGELYDDTPIYRFRYKGDPVTRIGLMAQDVEKTMPDAVLETASGYKMVDYRKATEQAARAA
jgi:hypothetical protein